MSMLQQHKHALNANRLRLVRELHLSDELFAVLQADYTLTGAMVDEIRVPTTSQGRTGKLLDILPKRGPNAFSTFISALVETHQESLADLLDPSRTAPSSQPSSGHVVQPSQHSSGPVVQPSDPVSKARPGVDKLIPPGTSSSSGQTSKTQQGKEIQQPTDERSGNQTSSREPIQEQPRRNDTEPNSDIATIVECIVKSQKGGSCWAYNQLNPVDGGEPGRVGELSNGRCLLYWNLNANYDEMNFDEVNLSEAFKKSEFAVVVEESRKKTAKEIFQQLEREAKRAASALILLLFARINNDTLLGCDNQPVPINQIVDIFKKSTDLKGKPKVLIFHSIVPGTPTGDGDNMDSVVCTPAMLAAELSQLRIDDDNLAVLTITPPPPNEADLKTRWLVWSLVLLVAGFSKKYDLVKMLDIVMKILIQKNFSVNLKSSLKNGLYFKSN